MRSLALHHKPGLSQILKGASCPRNELMVGQVMRPLLALITCTKSLPLPWPNSSCNPTCTSKDGPFQRIYRSCRDKDPKDHHFPVGSWHSRPLSKVEAHVGNVLSGSHA